MSKEFPNSPGLHVTESVCSWSTSVQHHWEPRSALPLGSLNLRISDHFPEMTSSVPYPCPLGDLPGWTWPLRLQPSGSHHLKGLTRLACILPPAYCLSLKPYLPVHRVPWQVLPTAPEAPGALGALTYASSFTWDSPPPAPRNYLQSPSRLMVPSGVRRCAIRITQRAMSHSTV